jgi:hypothetical protein
MDREREPILSTADFMIATREETEGIGDATFESCQRGNGSE